MFDRIAEIIEYMAYDDPNSNYIAALTAEVGRLRQEFEALRSDKITKMQENDRLKYELESAAQRVTGLEVKLAQQKKAMDDILQAYDVINNFMLMYLQEAKSETMKSTHPQIQKRILACPTPVSLLSEPTRACNLESPQPSQA